MCRLTKKEWHYNGHLPLEENGVNIFRLRTSSAKLIILFELTPTENVITKKSILKMVKECMHHAF